MKPLIHNEIRGSWASILLPIQDDDSIDYCLLTEQIDRLIAIGVSGIYSNGTAGEFYNLREDEFDRVSEILANACNRSKMPFQIGVSHMSPVIAYERLIRTVHLTPGAVQVILPDWFPPNVDERIAFLQRMADCAGDIPLILYNPPHAKVVLSPENIADLKRAVPSLAGIKVGAVDEKWIQRLMAEVREISIFIPGHILASGIRMGAHGAYSNVACLNPRAAQQWYECIRSDIEEALRIEKKIQYFISARIYPYIQDLHYSNQAVDKFMACIGGWTRLTPRLRWPYKGIQTSEVKRLRAILKRLLPEFVEDRPLDNV
jgi:dihydrodipicolinate synthase/N-acetylneuraminate lyase